MTWPPSFMLESEHVRLEPLTAAHHDDLVAATRDGELWKLRFTAVPDPDGMAAEIARRRAIERIGATLDGVLRSHQLYADGSLRDTYVYSIIAAEWPAVRAALKARVR